METSCGFVLVNHDCVLLLQYPQGHWGFVKGHYEEADGSYQQTALRELREETSLEARHVEFLFIWESEIFRHHAFRIEAEGEVNIDPEEISEFRWWDQKEVLATFSHVNAILERL